MINFEFGKILITVGCLVFCQFCMSCSTAIATDSVKHKAEFLLKEKKRLNDMRQTEVKLIKIWTLDDKIFFGDFIKKRFQKPRILFVQVPDLPFSLLILNGKVSPLILDRVKWELWKIEGLGNRFERTTVITPEHRKLSLSKVKGDADIIRMWTLNFSDSVKNLTVEYAEIYDY